MDSMQQAKKLVVKFISQIIPRPRLPICISSDVIMIKVRWIKKEILSDPITMSLKITIPSPSIFLSQIIRYRMRV